jgi:hypothetical protein
VTNVANATENSKLLLLGHHIALLAIELEWLRQEEKHDSFSF